MAKALLPAALLLLLLLIACSEPTPTVVIEPTLTPQQEATTPVPAQPGPTLPTETSATATPRPTESPATAPPPRPTETPTTIPEPTATPAPTEDEPPASQLTPLLLDDPEAVASELSDRELACLAGVADPERLLTIFRDPDLATADEQTKVIQCFHDETVARLFLTGIILDAGPLSTETSACVRASFREIDLRSVMLAGLQGDPGTAMPGSMAALFLSMACLNQEEWNSAAPVIGMGPDGREGMQCLIQEMGGPEGMAAALGAGEENALPALFAAAGGCGLDMGDPPSQAPVAPTATPEPTSTATPTQPPTQPSGLWRGITVAPENRCSGYDPEDYHYSPSVEPRIVDAQGGIYSPYTGVWFESIRDTDIEHIVARSEAHDSGLCAADPDTRDDFASDLINLTLASPSVNRHQKSGYDAAEWLPELNQCWYVDRIIRVRLEYLLSIDRAEAEAIDTVLAG